MRMPYCTRLVAVEKSQADIRRLLLKYAAANVRLADEKRGLSLRFSLKMKGERHVLSLRVPVGSSRRNRQKRDRDEQSAWRALYWTMKSLVEAIHFKIEISDTVDAV